MHHNSFNKTKQTQLVFQESRCNATTQESFDDSNSFENGVTNLQLYNLNSLIFQLFFKKSQLYNWATYHRKPLMLAH